MITFMLQWSAFIGVLLSITNLWGGAIKDIILHHNLATVICGKEVSRRETPPRCAREALQVLAVSRCKRGSTRARPIQSWRC